MTTGFLTRRQACVLMAGVASTAAGASAAWAQGFPTRPVQLVVPFPPGGAVDIVGRLISKKFGERLGQPVVIENKGGAGTIVGASAVAQASADGHTLLISSGSTFTVNPALNPKLPYDPVKSFEPIGLVARVPLILLAHRDVPVNTLKQLVSAVQASPDKYVYGSFGNGTTGHFAGELMWSALGIRLNHVAYKGSAPAMNDLLGGQIPFSVDTVAAALPQLKSGKIKAIAVTWATRATQLPEVPTVAESGYAGFAADSWLAVVAPRGLPPEAKATLQKALQDTLADAEVRSKLVASGQWPGARLRERSGRGSPHRQRTAPHAGHCPARQHPRGIGVVGAAEHTRPPPPQAPMGVHSSTQKPKGSRT